MLAAEAFLREVVTAGIPTLGICFGHQLLAQALGGEVVRNPRGREIGSIEVHTTDDDPILDGIPSPFVANATHLDTVSKLPPGAKALARSTRDDHQIIRFTERVYGLQFHPEIDRFIMAAYLDARRAILETEGLDVDGLTSASTEAPFAIRVLENFVRSHAV
jgi:GMP synthase (glutamine-hydrolysing)